MASIGRSYTVGDGEVVRLASPAMDRALELEQRLDAPWLEEADSTGHRLWPVCVALARYLCADPGLVRGKRVVELGAGTGAAGLVCAALGARHVTVTDMPDALGLIQANIDRNDLSATVSTAPCTWGDEGHLAALSTSRFDVVIGCDIVYKQPAHVLEALAATQLALACGTAPILVAYEFRGSMLEDSCVARRARFEPAR